ncbi:MAG: transposase [Deinococcota bacterium]|jgi:putative transposase|nr:transposase [Deinococcota bacterium]
MVVTRRALFKVYPTAAQAVQLDEWNVLHARLYNACLEQRITAYRKCGKSLSYYDQQNELPALKAELPECLPLGSHALQETVRRVDRAFAAFFRRVKVGQKPGFPRFKSATRYKGFTYPDPSGWKFALGPNGKHGFLDITNFGKLKIRGKPRQWGKPTTLTLTRRNEQWYASITVRCEPNREAGTAAIGLDLGCESAMTLSNGDKVENPRYLRATLRGLKVLQRKLANQKRGGANREKTRLVLCRLHQKVANQRKDFQHQETAKLIKTYGLIATETLNVKNMTANGGRYKAGLNRSILDVGMATIKQMLSYKAEEADSFRLIEVPTRKVKPSQTCPSCGRQHKKLLSTRWHSCECGCELPRDVAAAQVMLAWANNELGTGLLASPCSLGIKTQETTPIAVRLGA